MSSRVIGLQPHPGGVLPSPPLLPSKNKYTAAMAELYSLFAYWVAYHDRIGDALIGAWSNWQDATLLM